MKKIIGLFLLIVLVMGSLGFADKIDDLIKEEENRSSISVIDLSAIDVAYLQDLAKSEFVEKEMIGTYLREIYYLSDPSIPELELGYNPKVESIFVQNNYSLMKSLVKDSCDNVIVKNGVYYRNSKEDGETARIGYILPNVCISDFKEVWDLGISWFKDDTDWQNKCNDEEYVITNYLRKRDGKPYYTGTLEGKNEDERAWIRSLINTAYFSCSDDFYNFLNDRYYSFVESKKYPTIKICADSKISDVENNFFDKTLKQEIDNHNSYVTSRTKSGKSSRALTSFAVFVNDVTPSDRLDAYVKVELTTEGCPTSGCKMPVVNDISKAACKVYIDKLNDLEDIVTEQDKEECEKNKFMIKACNFIANNYNLTLETYLSTDPENLCESGKINTISQYSPRLLDKEYLGFNSYLSEKYSTQEDVKKNKYNLTDFIAYLEQDLLDNLKPVKIDGVPNYYNSDELMYTSPYNGYATCLVNAYGSSVPEFTPVKRVFYDTDDVCITVITPLIFTKVKKNNLDSADKLAEELKQKIEPEDVTEEQKIENFSNLVNSKIYELIKKFCPNLGANVFSSVSVLVNVNIFNYGEIDYLALSKLIKVTNSTLNNYFFKKTALISYPEKAKKNIELTYRQGGNFNAFRTAFFGSESSGFSSIDPKDIIYFADDAPEIGSIIKDIQGVANEQLNLVDNEENKKKMFEVLKQEIQNETAFALSVKYEEGKVIVVTFDSKLYINIQNNLITYLSKIWNVPVKDQSKLSDEINKLGFSKSKFESSSHLKFIEELSMLLYKLDKFVDNDNKLKLQQCNSPYQCLIIQSWIEMLMSYSDSCTPSENSPFEFKGNVEEGDKYTCIDTCKYNFLLRRYETPKDHPEAICGTAGIMAYDFVDDKTISNAKFKKQVYPDPFIYACLTQDKGSVKECLSGIFKSIKLQDAESDSKKLAFFARLAGQSVFVKAAFIISTAVLLSSLTFAGVMFAMPMSLFAVYANYIEVKNINKLLRVPKIYPDKFYKERMVGDIKFNLDLEDLASEISKNENFEEEIQSLVDSEKYTARNIDDPEFFSSDLGKIRQFFFLNSIKNFKLRYSYKIPPNPKLLDQVAYVPLDKSAQKADGISTVLSRFGYNKDKIVETLYDSSKLPQIDYTFTTNKDEGGLVPPIRGTREVVIKEQGGIELTKIETYESSQLFQTNGAFDPLEQTLLFEYLRENGTISEKNYNEYLDFMKDVDEVAKNIQNKLKEQYENKYLSRAD